MIFGHNRNFELIFMYLIIICKKKKKILINENLLIIEIIQIKIYFINK
jgi:hypothetical protein